MSLAKHIAAELQRLRTRLDREGLPDVRCLEYSRYLQTALWKKIKLWILERDLQRCVVCKREKINRHTDDMDVHHRSYDPNVLEGQRDDLLVSLCRRCHKKVEFYNDGSKRTSLADKDAEYLRIKAIHECLEQTGLVVRITETYKRSACTLKVVYAGNAAFQEFYSVDDLMMSFVFYFQKKHRESVTYPQPFGRNKLKLKGGVKILDRESKRSFITVNSDENVASIRIARHCSFPILDILNESIMHSKYWRRE